MSENKIGTIPEFTNENGTGEEVKEGTTEEVVQEEKDTPTALPTDTKPAEEKETSEETTEEEIQTQGDDTGALLKQVQGLQSEREKLLKEIQDLRGTRREIKQEQVQKVDQKIDELKDLHPDDINIIEKVLRAKGYVTKEEASKMNYEMVKQEELNKFLEKYPEYKPENDKNDINWNALQRELGYYRLPTNPHDIKQVLERAHRIIQKPSDRGVIEKQRRVETAQTGAGGTQRSSSGKSFTAFQKEEYRRGGWSEEEIQEMEKKL